MNDKLDCSSPAESSMDDFTEIFRRNPNHPRRRHHFRGESNSGEGDAEVWNNFTKIFCQVHSVWDRNPWNNFSSVFHQRNEAADEKDNADAGEGNYIGSTPPREVKISYSVFQPKQEVVGVEEDNLIIFHEKIRVEEFSSPYSATVLLSIPQQGKLTVKADMIFDDFLGIDLHQKIILMKEIGPNVIHKHGIKHISSSAQPKDVRIVEDDNDCTSRGATEQPRKSSTEEADYIPSFNLLDEKLEESKRSSLKLVDEDSEGR